MTSKPEIFFSYAWGDKQEQGESREQIVNELYNSLKQDGCNVKMDKHDLGYKGMITEFMKRIGKGQFVVVAISDKYLHSEYCMYELLEIYRKSNSETLELIEKIFPIVLDDAKIYTAEDEVDYIAFWEDSVKLLTEKLKNVNPANAIPQIENLRIRNEIANNIGTLCNVLRRMNTLNPALLSANNFSEIKKAIAERIAGIEQVYTTATDEAQIGIIPKLLTPPPFLSEVFLGRKDDLETIRKKLFEGDNLLLLVNGDGGVGKTTLAARYYHNHANSYQHLAWVLSEKNIANALLQLAVPLGIQFGEMMNSGERLELLVQKMAGLPRPCLLVIDNANEISDLEANYMALRRCPNFHLLLTTRITGFAKAATCKIGALAYAEALELFKELYTGHDTAEGYLFGKVYEAVGGNTLVIELLAKNLYAINTYQRHYSLGELVADLQKGLLAISKTKPVDITYHTDRLLKGEPLEIIETMYDISELSDAEKRLLSILAVLPAENIPFTSLQTVLPGTANLEDTLTSLAIKGWVEHNQFDSAFKISPVVQEITRKKNEDLVGDCSALIDRLIFLLDYEVGTGHFTNTSYKEAAVYARYGETVAGNFSVGDKIFIALLERLGSCHQTLGNLPMALHFYSLNVQLCKALCDAQPDDENLKNGLAIAYSKLGQTHGSLGNLSKALSYFELDATVLFKALFDSYPDNVGFKNGLAIAYSKLGETHGSLGNLSKALSYYEDATVLFKALFDSYPDNVGFKNGLAIAYSKLGETHGHLGNLSKALSYYEERSKLGKELFDAYRDNVGFKNGLAISYERLGQTHSSLGNLSKALSYYEERSKLGKELFEAYPDNVGFKNGLAIAYSKLGDTHGSLRNLSKALSYYEERSKLGKELFDAYPDNVDFKNGLAVSFSKLGTTHDSLGDMAKRNDYYLRAKALWQQLAKDFPEYVEFTNNLKWVNGKLA